MDIFLYFVLPAFILALGAIWGIGYWYTKNFKDEDIPTNLYMMSKNASEIDRQGKG